MRIAVVRESAPGENRVALVPELVGEVIGLGYEVAVEPGAGEAAGFADREYADAGALLLEESWDRADVVLAVQGLRPDQAARLRPGTGYLALRLDEETVAALCEAEVTSFAMESIPRISRAQPMDAVTSQALVAGYRGAVVAAGLSRRFLPAAMTAAGTVGPAAVLVLGAGVAGLEAIATLQRLGAKVSAYDVRASSAEEIASLGARPLDLDLEPLDGEAGYARSMTAGRAAVQRARLAPHVAAADIVIAAAWVPGRQAPMLVSREMVADMGPGAVVVDLAAEAGGNVEGSEPGTIVRIGRAQVWGGAAVAAQMPEPASQLYARNVLSLLAVLTTSSGVASDGGQLALFAPDFTDEVVAGAAVTYAGSVVRPGDR